MKRVLSVVVGVLVLLLAVVGLAQAQTPTDVFVPYSTARMQWVWAQGAPPNDGVPTEFRAKCGTASGSYAITKVLSDISVRSVLIKDVVSQVGVYFCVVTVANADGESPPSNEVTFRAGKLPAPATGFSVVIP